MENKSTFDTVRSMMEENFASFGNATRSYLDLLQKNMLRVPNANEDQIKAFRGYLDRQIAANEAFVSKLLRAKDIPEAVQVQVEYFQSQMKTSVSDAMQLSEKMTASPKT
jgi:hypothetical protein